MFKEENSPSAFCGLSALVNIFYLERRRGTMEGRAVERERVSLRAERQLGGEGANRGTLCALRRCGDPRRAPPIQIGIHSGAQKVNSTALNKYCHDANAPRLPWSRQMLNAKCESISARLPDSHTACARIRRPIYSEARGPRGDPYVAI